MNTAKTISVLVVDDSALIRSLMKSIIENHPRLRFVGAAADAFAAKDMVKRFRPDVITLDIEMPKVDGLTFLDRLMKAQPTPVVMISTLTEEGADATMTALELGAVDFIAKPKLNVSEEFMGFAEYVADTIIKAAQAKIGAKRRTTQSSPIRMHYTGTELIVGIGASTGGTEAIKAVVTRLPAAFPAVVIAQHMPPGFTKSFAARLNSLCAIQVKEAEHNERLLPGHAYIAPGDYHLRIIRSGADYRAQLDQEDRVSGHRPSVDVMFQSLADNVRQNALGMILTGMGKDGAQGLLAMRDAGSVTFGQNEASCVVYGMPKEAMKMGAVEHELHLDSLANALADAVSSRSKGIRV